MRIQSLSWRFLAITTFSVLTALAPSRAEDLSNGVMVAVPTQNGKAPALDGTDTGWDLSGSEPIWYSAQLAKDMHAILAVNYSDSDLFVYARVSLPGRKLNNPNGSADPFWQGDLIEFRLASDPNLPRPLSRQNPRVSGSDRICHLSIWKDTLDGKTYVSIHYGDMHGGGKGDAFNPPGSQIVVTEKENQYLVQAKIPWSALHAPDGKNPFGPGQRMTAIFGLHWKSPTFFYSANAVYAQNPGDFAFLAWDKWGQIEFSPTGDIKPRHGTMEEALAQRAANPIGVPIDVEVPSDSKISVNILGEHGEVLRELVGGLPVKAGKFTTYWDGKDQWGFGLAPGNYHWGAYLSKGLKARYVGFVGTSGTPPYQTLDGKGGWGGDHGVPIAVAADASGIYFGWMGAEAQSYLVKVDYQGNTLWRKSPFVKGGFAGMYALGSNGKYLFAIYVGDHPQLCRLDAATGRVELYGTQLGQGASVPIVSGNTPIPAPDGGFPAEIGTNKGPTVAECIGVAATDKEVFASIYSQNIIQVLDIATGQPTRTLSCPAPRGLTLDAGGNLYAVSYGSSQAPQIVRFDGTQGDAKPVITSNLVAPFGVAVDASGQISVTDEGSSQQVKTFSADGKLVRTLGKRGGRPWAGTYDDTSYLSPAGIVADKQGALIVAEASIPKIFDRIDLASGKTLMRWFGWPGYGNSNIGDPDDPMTSWYPFEPEGFARATVPSEGGRGYPNAYWVPAKAQPDANPNPGYRMLPFVSRLDNGKKYFIDDENPHDVSLVEGDRLVPVGYLDVHNAHERGQPKLAQDEISMWIATDDTGRSKPGEVVTITKTEDGKSLPVLGQGADSIWIDPKGDAFLVTASNAIIEIPSAGFAPNGAIKWQPDQAKLIVSPVLPSKLDRLFSGPRTGICGVRADAQGNIYTCLNTELPSLTPELADKIKSAYPNIPQSQWCVYADADIAKRMHEGLGHTAESNAVKFAKFGPDGRMLWIAGRKATAAPTPGEMYHFWSLAGIVDDKYVAGASEWGPFYFYTSDGYYVDSLMEDPAVLAPPGPYTFGSETFGGRIETYDKLGKVYAYNQGAIYAVDGFTPDLKVEGEQRLAGTVKLDKVYESATATLAQSLALVPVTSDAGKPETWSPVPVSTLTRAGNSLATAQLGYDAANLYVRIHVSDETPLQNGADDLGVVFKGGDVVGLDLGPAGDRSKPGAGDVRLLAAMVHGQPRLLGMKVVSGQAKQPLAYTTPASGTKAFDFVGEVPGGSASLVPDADGKGYTALLTVPRAFVEVPINAGANLKGDIEVLLSGEGQRGLQAVSRNWLYSGGHVETTMVDDIPTEAWLYPQYWGDINVK